jgi:hypothetical protein
MNELNVTSDKDKLAALRKSLGSFTALQNTLQDGDWPPTTQMIKGVNEAVAAYEAMMKK